MCGVHKTINNILIKIYSKMKQTLNVIARESGAERLTIKQWVIVAWWVMSMLLVTANVESIVFYAFALVNFLCATYNFRKLPLSVNE